MSDQHNPHMESFNPQGPGAYGGTPAPEPAPTPKKGKIGLVALILAAAGLLFSVIEGFYLLGWVLLPVAFILALVALIQRNQDKKLAAGAMAVTVIGFIAAPMAFLSTVDRIFDDAFSGGEVKVESVAPAESSDGEAAEASGTDTDQEADGTRTNPYPVGTAISNDSWKVTVNEFTPDATKKVLAYEFNDKPGDGNVYAMVNLTLTYLGEDSDDSSSVGVSYVTEGGNVVNSWDNLVIAPEGFGMDELYNGAKATGNVVLEIPKDDAGTLRVRPGMFADEVFFATK